MIQKQKITLNNLKEINQLDQSKMAKYIEDLPDQFLQAFKKAKKEIQPLSKMRKISQIIIAGMGGSGVAGEIVQTLVADQLKIPLEVIHDWHLPDIDKDCLVILVSFSGGTEETLNCFQEAKKKKASTFFISQKKFPEADLNFTFNFSGQPRAGLGYLTMPILVLLEKLNFIDLQEMEIANSLKKLNKCNKEFFPEIKTEKNLSKYLAYSCFGYLPYIISSEKYRAIAKRYKTQINENAKSFAVFETLPEAAHHTIESQKPEIVIDQINFLVVEDEELDEQNRKTLANFQKLLKKDNLKFDTVTPVSGNLFTRLISLILIGDWLSFYLAILYQVDPTPVEKIKWFKSNVN